MKIIKFNLPTWFLNKNNMLSRCSSDRRNGYGFVPSDIFIAKKESEKAYYVETVGWIPKAIILNLQIEEYNLEELLNQKKELEEKKAKAHLAYKKTHSDEDFDVEMNLLSEIKILEQNILELKRCSL